MKQDRPEATMEQLREAWRAARLTRFSVRDDFGQAGIFHSDRLAMPA